MIPVVFIDTNVPIYAAGRAHPLKGPCAQVLLPVAEHSQAFARFFRSCYTATSRYGCGLRGGMCSGGSAI